MVFQLDRGTGMFRFILRANRSASWLQNKVFFAVLAFVSLTIATGFSVLGFWPVLPFAGAELAFLGICLWWTACRADTTEVVDIDEQTVAVQRGRNAPQQRWSFQRAWAQIRLVRSFTHLHPSRLFIGSHGRNVQLGAFLTESERRAFAKQLRSAVRMHSSA